MTCRVLIVDDNPDFCRTLSGVLSEEGHGVHIASNEGEALVAVTQQSFDFALIDVRLHGEEEEDESGLSLAMALCTLKPRTRIIMLSRYVRTRQIVQAVRYLGVVNFIDKSQDVGKQVLETIAAAPKDLLPSRLETAGDATQLALSLTQGRPLTARARGYHVCSTSSPRELRLDLDRYARKVENARQDRDNLRFEVRDIGEGLWQEVFEENPEAKEAYKEARAKGRLLSLVFEASREFLSLPVEFMRSDKPKEYLVLQHPLTRFVRDVSPKREALSPQTLALTGELKVLIIGSNTKPRIDGVDVEVEEIFNYLQGQQLMPVSVKYIPTEQATYEVVKEELRKTDYDIIHYAGHGRHEANSPEESGLYFWSGKNRLGDVVPLQATELKLLLDRSAARLVYLSSCYGTATGSEGALLDDDFLGLADAVAQAGVPSVLGFRWPVSDKRAHKLALAFYQSLLEQGSPEIALWNARRELAANRKDTTWLSPILIHQV